MAKNGEIQALIEQLRVEPGKPSRLHERDPADKLGLDTKDKAQAQTEELEGELDLLHNRLWAEASRGVLLVLQGMDGSGKDSTIRRVLSGLNPQGCQVAGFKAPSDVERAQDYLWRVHAVCPPRGQLGVFNRSHYEDVVAARFVGAADHDECRRRYGHIRDFERLLTDEGTTVVKVFLHMSKEEQRVQLQERIDDPEKRWKFKLGDLDVRKQWGDYMVAYEEVLTETSSEHAPWYVVPANRKWVRDLSVATLLIDTFRRLDPQFPPLDPEAKGVVVE